MGWFNIEAADGTRSKVDKTFGYVCDDDGTLRIVVHHSTSPFLATDLLKGNLLDAYDKSLGFSFVLAPEASLATPNRYRGYIELSDPLINVHDRFN